MKNSKIAIIAIVLIALIAVAISGCIFDNKTNSTSANASTKVAFINNGTTWFHFDAVIENMTMKNGTVQNFYVQGYMKPGGNVTIDLSSLAGYGTEKLPAGTTIRIMAWKGLYNQTLNGTTSDLQLVMQGWSNVINPQTEDLKYNVAVQNLTVNQLPANITDNTVLISTDAATMNTFNTLIQAGQLPVFEEEVLTVDANGRVSLVFVTPATLCNIVA